MPPSKKNSPQNTHTVVLQSRGNRASKQQNNSSKQDYFHSTHGSCPQPPPQKLRETRCRQRTLRREESRHTQHISTQRVDLLQVFGIDSGPGRMVTRLLVTLLLFQPVYIAMGMEIEEGATDTIPAVDNESSEAVPSSSENDVTDEKTPENDAAEKEEAQTKEMQDQSDEENKTPDEEADDDINVEEVGTDDTQQSDEGVEGTQDPVSENEQESDTENEEENNPTTDENDGTENTDPQNTGGDDNASSDENLTDGVEENEDDDTTQPSTDIDEGEDSDDSSAVSEEDTTEQDSDNDEESDTENEEENNSPIDETDENDGTDENTGSDNSEGERDDSDDNEDVTDESQGDGDDDATQTGTEGDDNDTGDTTETETTGGVGGNGTTSPEEEVMDDESERNIAQNPTNKYVFGEGDCTLVSDGEFYCVAEGPERQQMTGDPRVYAQKDREGDKEIYYFDGIEVKRITNNSYDDFAPMYDEETRRIVWQSMISDRLQVMVHELPTDITRQVTTSRQNSSNPSISGDTVVWQEWVDTNWEIMMTDVDNNGQEFEIERLTDNAIHDMFPSAYDDLITWQSERGSSWEVIVYDMRTGKQHALEKNEDTKYENPRFVLLFDSKHENGDIETVGYDLDTGEMMELGTKSSPLPVEPMTPKDETPDAVYREATSSTQIKVEGDEDEDGNDDTVVL